MTVQAVTRTAMQWIPGGRFVMGDDRFYAEEGPAHPVDVDGFWLDREPVTNAHFREFVHDTGYLTVAERDLDPADYPGVARELLVPGSAVFIPPTTPVDLEVVTWWHYMRGASWHAPEGPGSRIDDRLDHPVVHVAFEDATAYAEWAGKRLPTEAEWEFAARGGLAGTRYAWGDLAEVDGRVPANIWPGTFPRLDKGDSFGTAPVGSFPENAYGLVDMAGNVWEWTTDWYEPGHRVGCCVPSNPRGPLARHKDPLALGGESRVLKGGSFLCADNYCARYRPAARIPQAVETATANVGFRCVADVFASRRPEEPPIGEDQKPKSHPSPRSERQDSN